MKILFAFRKTLLGPTYGSPLEKIQILPTTNTTDPQKCYLAYVTKDKVWSPICLTCARAPSCRGGGPWGNFTADKTMCRLVLPES